MEHSPSTVATWWGVALACATPLAFVAYGLLHVALERYEERQRQRVTVPPPRRLGGLKFWVKRPPP